MDACTMRGRRATGVGGLDTAPALASETSGNGEWRLRSPRRIELQLGHYCAAKLVCDWLDKPQRAYSVGRLAAGSSREAGDLRKCQRARTRVGWMGLDTDQKLEAWTEWWLSHVRWLKESFKLWGVFVLHMRTEFCWSYCYTEPSHVLAHCHAQKWQCKRNQTVLVQGDLTRSRPNVEEFRGYQSFWTAQKKEDIAFFQQYF